MATANSNPILGIEKLKGNNYQSWSWNMRMHLTATGLFGAVEEQRPAEAGERQEQFDRNDAKAAAYLCLAVDTGIVYHIRDLTNAKEIWDKLKQLFDSSSSTHQTTLIMRLSKAKLSSPRFLEEHINTFMITLSGLHVPRESMPESVTIGLFMASLPEYYTPIIDALLTKEDLTLHEAISEIREYQERQNLMKYNRQTKGTGEELPGLLERDLRIKDSSSSGTPPGRKFSTSKAGSHRQGPSPKAAGKRNRMKATFNVGLLKEKLLQIAENQNPNVIIIDSGATSHYFSRREFFMHLNMNVKLPVCLANGKEVNAQGKGTVLLQVRLGTNRTRILQIRDVFYVPDLRASLYSVRTATASGTRMLFKKESCFGFHGKDLIFKGVLRNECYEMEIVC